MEGPQRGDRGQGELSRRFHVHPYRPVLARPIAVHDASVRLAGRHCLPGNPHCIGQSDGQGREA